MVIYSLTSQAGGSQEHLLEVEESAPDFCRDSFAVTTQVSIAAMWEQASPSLYIYTQNNQTTLNSTLLYLPSHTGAVCSNYNPRIFYDYPR